MALRNRKKTPTVTTPPAPPTLEQRLGYAQKDVQSGVSLAQAAVTNLEDAGANLREVSREAQAEAARLAGIAQLALVEAEAATRSADAVKVVIEGH